MDYSEYSISEKYYTSQVESPATKTRGEVEQTEPLPVLHLAGFCPRAKQLVERWTWLAQIQLAFQV